MNWASPLAVNQNRMKNMTENTKKRILFVDDEQNILNTLRRLLFPMRKDWDIRFVLGGLEALEILEKERFDVIVSDLRMPGMDGVELLQIVRDRYPDVVRIVLSGQCDQEVYLKSIGPTHQYLSKPVDLETLKSAITNACNLREMLNADKLRSIIAGMNSLPALSSTFQELTVALRSPNVSVKIVADIISKDVSMTLKLLQLVNSAYFGLPKQVASIEMAVNMLGLNSIAMLALSVKLFHEFDRDVMPGISLDQLWKHCMRTSMFAKQIARLEKMGKDEEDVAMIAGLLHDVGKAVLADNFQIEYEIVCNQETDENIPLHIAEREIFGTDHAEVGAYLLALWGFNDPVVEAVAFHHNPRKRGLANLSPLTAVYIGNVFDRVCKRKDQPLCLEDFDQAYIIELGLENRIPAWHGLIKRFNENDPKNQ